MQKQQTVKHLRRQRRLPDNAPRMWIDIVFLVVFLYGFWQGWSQGIIGTLLNIAIYVFGIMLAYKMAPVMSSILERIFNSHHPMMFVAGFATNMLLIYLIVHLASESIEEALNRAYLGVFNRALGGVVVAGFYVLLYSVLIWFAGQANALTDTTTRESKTYPFLKDLPKGAKAVVVRVQPLAADVWDDSVDWMDKMQKYGVEKTDGKAKVYELPVEEGEEPFETKPKDSGR